jgi:hypothetical protein
MMTLLVALAFLVLSAPLVLAIVRANELFFLRIREGKVSVARGRIPQRLLDDIADVVRGIDRGSLRGVVEDRRPRLYTDGELTPEQKQRLRNLIGTWSVAQIRTAPRRR